MNFIFSSLIGGASISLFSVAKHKKQGNVFESKGFIQKPIISIPLPLNVGNLFILDVSSTTVRSVAWLTRLKAVGPRLTST
jgi:hypothetical protein